MIIVLSIFHYQTGHFIPALEHYVSSRSVENPSCCTCIHSCEVWLLEILEYIVSEAILQHRINSLQKQIESGTSERKKTYCMEIKIAAEKLNNETAQITLPGRSSTNGSWLTKKINLRRCADLHS